MTIKEHLKHIREEEERLAPARHYAWTPDCLNYQEIDDVANGTEKLTPAQAMHVLYSCPNCLSSLKELCSLRGVSWSDVKSRLRAKVFAPFAVTVQFVCARTRGGRIGRKGGMVQTDEDAWNLLSDDGGDFVLPSDIAQRCYGESEMIVALRLCRYVDDEAEEEMFKPYVEVSPAPEQDSFTVILHFANGAVREFVVDASGQSDYAESLPSDVFGRDEWDIGVSVRSIAARGRFLPTIEIAGYGDTKSGRGLDISDALLR